MQSVESVQLDAPSETNIDRVLPIARESPRQQEVSSTAVPVQSDELTAPVEPVASIGTNIEYAFRLTK